MADQIEVPCVLMRGGTSKGLYLHARDLPPAGDERDRLLVRLMGSPDLLQIDGLGGSRPITSKIAILSPSEREDADVDYLFAQVEIDKPSIFYNATCGNISAGVGPFAIDEGLVRATGDAAIVRIHNVNTGKLFSAIVRIVDGKAAVLGDFAIPGVPGTGAEIVLDYTGTVGACSGRLLPTGNAVDEILLESGERVRASLVDVANACAFVDAGAFGLTGSELPREIDPNSALFGKMREVRGKIARIYGLCDDWRDVDSQSPGLPLTVMVSPPDRYVASNGHSIERDAIDLRARLIFMGRCHESMAGAASVCLAAASRVPGTIVQQVAASREDGALFIGHPLGSMRVTVDAEVRGDDVVWHRIGMSRTARRLMAGTAYIPRL